MFDAGNLLELIARDRAKRADRDRLVGEVLEFMQAPVEPDIGCDDFRPFIVALLARLRRDRLDQTLAGKLNAAGVNPARPKSVAPAASVSATL